MPRQFTSTSNSKSAATAALSLTSTSSVWKARAPRAGWAARHSSLAPELPVAITRAPASATPSRWGGRYHSPYLRRRQVYPPDCRRKFQPSPVSAYGDLPSLSARYEQIHLVKRRLLRERPPNLRLRCSGENWRGIISSGGTADDSNKPGRPCRCTSCHESEIWLENRLV